MGPKLAELLPHHVPEPDAETDPLIGVPFIRRHTKAILPGEDAATLP